MTTEPFEDDLLEFKILFHPGKTEIRLHGEVDFAAAPSLAAMEHLATEAGQPVNVDLSEVTFLDSTGLAFLARLVTAGSHGGWTLTVAGAQRVVQDVIEISGLSPVLKLIPRGDERVIAFAGEGLLERASG